MRTSVMHFAELGNPLATEQDWNREMQLASNPRASTRQQQSAADYVRPHTPYVRPRKLDPRDYPIVNPEKIEAMRTVRENLKLTLRAIKADEPVPMIAEARKPLPAPRAAPGTCKKPKAPKTSKQLKEEHAAWLRERRIEVLALDLGITPEQLKAKLA